MRKVNAIKELCSELVYNSEIHNQKIKNHLSLSAGLIESDITQEGCDDWSERSMCETAGYIREKVSLCSEQTLEDVYFLLVEISRTYH
jgi:hypothetical protein